MTLANSGYDDGICTLTEYYDQVTGAPVKEEGSLADGLARFIVEELRTTFDPEMHRDEQLEEARRAINGAIEQLMKVERALN